MHDDSRENVADWDGQPMTEHHRHHDAGVREIVAKAMADAWDEGYRAGKSRAMRHMSDEPNLPLAAPNPYRHCSCGAPETYSLNPNEVVVHRTDAPCYIAGAQ